MIEIFLSLTLPKKKSEKMGVVDYVKDHDPCIIHKSLLDNLLITYLVK